MMKAMIFGAAMAMTVPAVAQQTPAPSTQPTAPAGAATDQTVTPAPTDPATQPTQQAAEAGQPATGAQIAQIVEAEFPKYDKAGTGQLTEAQFSDWLVTLRAASEPGVTAEKPEVKAWAKQAFAQADTDKSKAVSKAELTSFLSQGAG